MRRGRIGDRVDVATAGERVGAEPALKRVRTGTAVDHVAVAIAGQHVGPCRADKVQDIGQDVALGVVAGPGTGSEVHSDCTDRRGVVSRIRAAAALKRVAQKTADQHVVAGTAIEQVGIAVAGQMVGVGRAGDVLDVGEDVALGVEARRRASQQIDRHRTVGVGIVEAVDARAAIQAVSAEPARQHVVACDAQQCVGTDRAIQRVRSATAIQQVGVAVTRDQVGIARADHIGDQAENVALCIAAKARAGSKVDGDRRRSRVVNCIDPATAEQRVGPAPARQRIGTAAAIDQVVRPVTRQDVGLRGTGQVLDVGERVAGRIAAGCSGRREVDRDRTRRGGIIERVDAAAAVDAVAGRAARDAVVARRTIEGIAAAAAGQRVGRIAAIDQVGVAVTGYHVGRGRAQHVGDIHQNVALCIAAGTRAIRQVDGHRQARGGVIRKVDAAAALQRIGAETAAERVSTGSAVQDVGVSVAGEVVGVPRAEQIVDA